MHPFQTTVSIVHFTANNKKNIKYKDSVVTMIITTQQIDENENEQVAKSHRDTTFFDLGPGSSRRDRDKRRTGGRSSQREGRKREYRGD